MKKIVILSLTIVSFILLTNLAQATQQIVESIPFTTVYYSLIDYDSGYSNQLDQPSSLDHPYNVLLEISNSDYNLELNTTITSNDVRLSSDWTNYGAHQSTAESYVRLLTDPFYAESIAFDSRLFSHIDTVYDAGIINFALTDLNTNEELFSRSEIFNLNSNPDLNDYNYWFTTLLGPSRKDHPLQLMVEFTLRNYLFPDTSGNVTTIPTQSSSSFIELSDINLVSIRYTDDNNSPIPEPSTLLLLGVGLGVVGIHKLRNKHKG